MTSSEPDRTASRRGLLRKAAVAGGAAVAATAVTTANATPASAASGDPLTIGLPNEAAGTTAVLSSAPGATLALKNSTGAPLHLKRQDVTSPEHGSIFPTRAGLGYSVHESGVPVRYEAHTTANSTMLVPIPPTRILDTRSAAGRARLVEGAGRIDSQGRAVADSFLVVHLQGIAEYADGMLGNITVAKTEKAGFVTVYGRGDRPNASTINWWSAGQLLSNGVITQLGAYETANGDYYPDVVGIYVPKASATALILDVTGLLVFHPDSAVINSPKTTARTSLAAESGTAEVRARQIKALAERGDREVRTGE
ncbi:hypothetical protein GA0070609_0694 [Micromonospora echinaurantiaca]|uniref:Uncharacterized protein n=1 Tax=Micromonospora echinaurantiaca TaxID=47857 RepID=A0A1C5GZY7_9ACTN|nr:hypothetical protein [Micromonospora echinaurantiaca]SCG39253.1 hypothetical protein GA0070609_0694 [Micromonospora echinaurantiaca]